MSNGIYIYGIVEKGEKNRNNFGAVGINSSEIYTIPYKDIEAVVSNVSGTAPLNIENAKAHENVIRKVLEKQAIIPMSFGMVATNGSQVEKILGIGYKVFKALLEKIANKVQIDVKLLWEKDKIYLDILSENEDIQKLAAKVDKNEAQKIELGKFVKEALDCKREFYIAELKEILANFSEQIKENKLTNERMIAHLSCLVDKPREQEFYNTINEKEQSYKGKVQIIAIGPLPAYNFTKLKLKKLDFNIIDSARKILGLNEKITLEELEVSHRSLAYRYHPDRNPNDALAEQQFKRIEKAYAILADYCKHCSNKQISLTKENVDKTILILEE